MVESKPVGLMNGIFRVKMMGDYDWLHHCVFFDAKDLEMDSDSGTCLFNHKDPKNIYKSNDDDIYVLDATEIGGLVKYVNSTCVVDEVNVKLYRVLMDKQWNCEYWTVKNIKKGDIILSDYQLNFDVKEQEIDDDRMDYNHLDEDEMKIMKRYKKYQNCKCFKYGIKDCVNSSENEQQISKIERKLRKAKKSKLKTKR